MNVTGVFKFLSSTPVTVADTTCRLSGGPRRELAVFSPFSRNTLLKRKRRAHSQEALCPNHTCSRKDDKSILLFLPYTSV